MNAFPVVFNDALPADHEKRCGRTQEVFELAMRWLGLIR